ncbi:MAG: ABC transporter permease subunit [Oscillospiraceae bacterium]|nr:ABC transporter permease subunit [Oscillospiraceae bacterium]
MSGIVTVMKKEFARFFGDKRMILMTLLPAILIYVIYSFMGTAMADMFAPDADRTQYVYAVSAPDRIVQKMTDSGLTIHHIALDDVDAVKYRISERNADLLVIFPDHFLQDVEAFDPRTTTALAPNVAVYFNSAEPNSLDTYMRMLGILDAFEASITSRLFDINRDITDADLATTADLTASIIASILPLLLMIFLFSGCMGLAPESIAGEKERGTLATLLVTPLGRSELAAGKILSLAVLSFLSGLVTAIATVLAMPNLMAGAEEFIDVGIYGVVDYIWLALIILSTVLLFVAMISIVSAVAKSVKEANMAVTPMVIIVMVVSVAGMFGGGAQENPLFYLIPIYSSVQSMGGIFSMEYSAVNVALSAASNLIYACIGGFALTKMFNSEKVMFSR